VPAAFDDVDPVALFGDRTGGVVEARVRVSDGALDLEFQHERFNPVVSAIEILAPAPDDTFLA
jgi:hypothetical protein